jgi:DNA-binding CsgD family transcriptional regulator
MLLGRAAECGRIERLLADARAGTSGALVIGGDPGVGKTAVLEHAAADAAGMTVLRARGVESEAEVPFSGLLELLRPVLDRIASLPAPQAAALRGALALAPARERDRFAVGAATLSLLATCAEERPLLALVDDVQWLDASSVGSLVFATRRLAADSAAVIFAVRPEEAGALDRAGFPELRLEGLDREASAALLSRHAPAPVPALTAERLFRATGGNPLALVELAAAAPALAADLVEGPLTVQTSVERAFLQRTAALSADCRRALLVAAAAHSGELGTIARAMAALGVATQGLEEAERARLVTVTDARVEFCHPLARSAVYAAAAAPERRAAHRALADAGPTTDVDERAWHLASAAFGPDEQVAAALDAAAARARDRSAYAVAASAFQRAARLTPQRDDARARRLLSAADAAWLGGRAELTLRTVDEALTCRVEPALRAAALHLRGRALLHIGPVTDGHDALVAAAQEIRASDPARAIVMLAEAADGCVYAGRPETMLETARRAWALLPPAAGERETAFASFALGTALIFNGHGAEGSNLVRDAIVLIDGSDVLGDDLRLLSWAALAPLWLREAETGRALIERAIDAARAQGALGVLPFVLQIAALDSAASDRWAISEALHDEAIRLARDTGQAVRLCGALAGLARVEARRGLQDGCRVHAEEALAIAKRLRLGFYAAWAIQALGDLELAVGRLDVAIERLCERERLLAELRIADPDMSAAPELVEVYVRAGHVRDAERVAHGYLAGAQEKGQPWALARAGRCRGLLADANAFDEAFADGFDQHELTSDTFELARTQLCYGERLRRARRRTEARVQLRAAFMAFGELGAAPWAERARLELQATGETARRRRPSTLDQLTPQELRIALALADGKTMRAAAAELFLSPKTIEYHLRNAYRKLGIRSRAELLHALDADSAARTATRQRVEV